MKNKLLSWTPKILAILLGGFFIVFGGYDNSPGLQGIGLILIIAIIFAIIRGQKKKNPDDF